NKNRPTDRRNRRYLSHVCCSAIDAECDANEFEIDRSLFHHWQKSNSPSQNRRSDRVETSRARQETRHTHLPSAGFVAPLTSSQSRNWPEIPCKACLQAALQQDQDTRKAYQDSVPDYLAVVFRPLSLPKRYTAVLKLK